MARAIEIERNAVERAYDRWAPVYDLVFGPVFERGRRAAIDCGGAHRRPHSRGRRRDGNLAARLLAPQPNCRRGHIRSHAHEGTRPRQPDRAAARGSARGDGRRAAEFPGRLLRCRGGAVRCNRCSEPGSRTRRICARTQAGWRDHPAEPCRRRGRTAPHGRTPRRAGRRASSAGARSFPGSATRTGSPGPSGSI